MHLVLSCICLVLCLVNLGLSGTKVYRKYNVPHEYENPSEIGMAFGPYTLRKDPEIEKGTFIENTVGIIPVPDYVETSSLRMESVLRNMKLDRIVKKCHKKGMMCHQVVDCCSLKCIRSSNKCG